MRLLLLSSEGIGTFSTLLPWTCAFASAVVAWSLFPRHSGLRASRVKVLQGATLETLHLPALALLGAPFDQGLRTAVADADRVAPTVFGPFLDQFDDTVRVRDSSVGQQENLPRVALDILSVVDGVQRVEYLCPAHVGLHATHLGHGFVETLFVVLLTLLEQQTRCAAEADHVEISVLRQTLQEDRQGLLGLF